jgi:hypothetical protein
MAFYCTFAPSGESEVPLHKKTAKMLSIFFMVAHGRIRYMTSTLGLGTILILLVAACQHT